MLGLKLNHVSKRGHSGPEKSQHALSIDMFCDHILVLETFGCYIFHRKYRNLSTFLSFLHTDMVAVVAIPARVRTYLLIIVNIVGAGVLGPPITNKVKL